MVINVCLSRMLEINWYKHLHAAIFNTGSSNILFSKCQIVFRKYSISKVCDLKLVPEIKTRLSLGLKSFSLTGRVGVAHWVDSTGIISVAVKRDTPGSTSSLLGGLMACGPSP